MRTPRRTTWPKVRRIAVAGRPRVAIVVANYNTRRLIAQLIFSLYRILGRDQFDELVVVDNASTDGSRQLLVELDRAGLIHLLANARQRYHGPAVTQGMSWVARGQRSGVGAAVEYIWVLDSDVIVRRRETLRDALAVLKRERAAVVGQAVADPTYDVLLRHNPEMLQPFSLLLDPQVVWRRPIPPFVEDGTPAAALQIAADARGLRLVSFPFIEGRYLLHLGRGTLRAIAAAGDSANRYYGWALDHRDYHFAGQDFALGLLAVTGATIAAAVGAFSRERTMANFAACKASTVALTTASGARVLTDRTDAGIYCVTYEDANGGGGRTTNTFPTPAGDVVPLKTKGVIVGLVPTGYDTLTLGSAQIPIANQVFVIDPKLAAKPGTLSGPAGTTTIDLSDFATP